MRRLSIFFLLMLVLPATPSPGCFGPKLHVGVGPGVESRALAEIAMLYVKEKTGVESLQVEMKGEGGVALAGEKVDLAVARDGLPPAAVLIDLSGLAGLAAGPRPRRDIQFTTVVPALEKLAGLLHPADLREVLTAIAGGRPPAAAARDLLQSRRWI
jgi:hypothetical protein